MGAISLLEKLGVDPSVKISDLSAEQHAEVDKFLATMAQANNNPTLSINEPTDPDEDDPSKEA